MTDDPDQALGAMAAALRDAEERLRAVEERSDIAMRAINEGVYDWNLADGTIYYSARVHAALGMTPETMRTPQDWRERIHPEDLPKYDQTLVDHFKRRTERFECDYRFHALDGRWLWARQHGIAMRDAGGRAIRMIGSTGDITELKRTEEALKRSDERYALATRAATEGIYEWIIDTGDLYLSDRAREFWGFPSGPLKSSDWNSHIHPEDYAGYRQAVVEHLKGLTPALEHEMRARDAHGEYRWVHDRGMAVRDPAGRATKLVGATSDVTQRKRAEQELRHAHDQTKEALEQQTATAEILASISGSMTDTRPVFDAIVRNLLRLFGTRFAVVQILRDGIVEMPAVDGEPGFEKLIERYPRPLDESTVGGQAMLSMRTVQYSPVIGNPAAPAATQQFARDFGFDSVIFAPMVCEDRVLGAIGIAHHEPRVFDDRQVALIEGFADQAVIAIENVRLFNETTEALERQTATAEILKVIASSPTDLQPVLGAVAQRAAQLCESLDARIFFTDGDVARYVSGFGELAGVQDAVRITRGLALGRAIIDRAVVHVEDLARESATEFPDAREVQEKYGHRTTLAVPLLREDKAIGCILLRRSEVRPFSAKQIELLKTFADQAVIAIENVRLFEAVRQRTEALTRSVGQLTALGEVGQAISSTLDLDTVLKTIVTRAVQLAGLDGGVIYEYDERRGQFDMRASENFDEQSVDRLRRAGIREGEGAIGTSVVTRQPVQVPDTHAPGYSVRLRELLDRAGFHAVLAVPLVRDDQTIGALLVARASAGPFAPEIIDLLKTFASQSALAIQNARLFREIEDKGRQLETASRHKSDFLASMSHELRTPLNAILGFNELIMGEVYGEVPQDMKEPLADIQSSGKHLLGLINNVLDLAKIEAGRMELALADYSVLDTVARVHSTLRSLAAEKGLEFLASVPDEIPLVYGDSGRIAQCLMNLAGNSLKFTKAGRVEITVELNGEILVFRVADTGIGIAPDKIDSLFTEFKQTDATIASEYGGTGLGLSISKKFVEMHGGRIWVESQLGSGTSFLFELPLRAGKENFA